MKTMITLSLPGMQLLYKLSTPFTVGAVDHPVVISNLAIAAVHPVTLVLIWRGHGLGAS